MPSVCYSCAIIFDWPEREREVCAVITTAEEQVSRPASALGSSGWGAETGKLGVLSGAQTLPLLPTPRIS